MTGADIIKLLPYREPFLFVGTIDHLDDEGITGTYHFRKDEYFYKGHFEDRPITPGVILTECCAQIGVVSLALYLENGSISPIALTNTEMEFLKAVDPDTTVTVISKKKFYRLGKLKCSVVMTDPHGDIVCRGIISGVKIPTT